MASLKAMYARMWPGLASTTSALDAPNPVDEIDTPSSPSRLSSSSSSSQQCPLLALPTELRLHIYSYLDLSRHTLAVRSEPGHAHAHGGTHASHSLRFRIAAADARATVPRYAAVLTLPRVCALVRAEVMPLIFASNTFAFSDVRYDYATALPLVVEKYAAYVHLMRRIEWPLRPARDVQRFGTTLERPDCGCVEEFAKLVGLGEVVLRYKATDVGSAKMTDEERTEMGQVGYAEEREYRRGLAVRGMQVLLAREGVEVRSERVRE
jgi:hypothetical protein